MNCYRCQQQKVSLSGTGQCVECNHAVCERPPRRLDQQFHGEACGCGCTFVVCDMHLRQHALKHGGTPTSCFPAITSALGLTSISAVSQLAVTDAGAAPESKEGPMRQMLVDMLNRFLNVITPGHVALGKAASSVPNDLYEKVPVVDADSGAPPWSAPVWIGNEAVDVAGARSEMERWRLISFVPRFFTVDVLRRVERLAAHELLEASPRINLEWLESFLSPVERAVFSPAFSVLGMYARTPRPHDTTTRRDHLEMLFNSLPTWRRWKHHVAPAPGMPEVTDTVAIARWLVKRDDDSPQDVVREAVRVR
jgi:hypothetical protein